MFLVPFLITKLPVSSSEADVPRVLDSHTKLPFEPLTSTRLPSGRKVKVAEVSAGGVLHIGILFWYVMAAEYEFGFVFKEMKVNVKVLFGEVHVMDVLAADKDSFGKMSDAAAKVVVVVKIVRIVMKGIIVVVFCFHMMFVIVCLCLGRKLGMVYLVGKSN